MSKLDEILEETTAPRNIKDVYGDIYLDFSFKEAKQQIKSLFIELISSYELTESNRPGHNMDVTNRNALRTELKKKVWEL